MGLHSDSNYLSRQKRRDPQGRGAHSRKSNTSFSVFRRSRECPGKSAEFRGAATAGKIRRRCAPRRGLRPRAKIALDLAKPGSYIESPQGRGARRRKSGRFVHLASATAGIPRVARLQGFQPLRLIPLSTLQLFHSEVADHSGFDATPHGSLQCRTRRPAGSAWTQVHGSSQSWPGKGYHVAMSAKPPCRRITGRQPLHVNSEKRI